jgi:hypothetical protein
MTLAQHSKLHFCSKAAIYCLEPFGLHKCRRFLNRHNIWSFLLLQINRLQAQGSSILKKSTFL